VLPGPPRTLIRTGVFRSLANSPQFAGFSAVQMACERSLSGHWGRGGADLPSGLWALQTRSWQADLVGLVLNATILPTTRASRAGVTTRLAHRAGERCRHRAAGDPRWRPLPGRARGRRARSSY